jgi:hypothetical protein
LLGAGLSILCLHAGHPSRRQEPRTS